MNAKIISTIIHVLAILSGLSSLLAVALTQPPFSVSPIVAGGFALASTVMSYIANQLPALGDIPPTTPSPSPKP